MDWNGGDRLGAEREGWERKGEAGGAAELSGMGSIGVDRSGH